MPIYGLTDRQESFLRLAKIKKGEKTENGGMRDLDYFRLTYSHGCEDVEKAFKAIYGEKPTRINIRLAFPRIEKNWDAYYTAYETGGLLAKAGSDENGLFWVWYMDYATKKVWVRNGRPIGPQGEEFITKKIDITQPVYSYPEKKKGVKTGNMISVYLEPEGRLSVVIPELAMIDGKPRVGYYDFCPTSPRDIGNISGELAGIDLWAKQVGKDITGIPMVLTRRKEMVPKNINGVRSVGPSWVVHIEVGGEWGGKALEFMQMKALPDVIDGQVEVIEDSEFVDVNPGLTPAQPFPASIVPVTQAPSDNWEEGYQPPFGNSDPAPEPKHEPHDSPLLAGNEKKEEKKETKLARPYPPAVFREKLLKIISQIPAQYQKDNVELVVTDHERKVLASCLDGVFNDKGVSRHPLCMWLVGHGSTAEMTPAEVKAFFLVMGIQNTIQHPAQFNDPPSAESIQELRDAYQEASKER